MWVPGYQDISGNEFSDLFDKSGSETKFLKPESAINLLTSHKSCYSWSLIAYYNPRILKCF